MSDLPFDELVPFGAVLFGLLFTVHGLGQLAARLRLRRREVVVPGVIVDERYRYHRGTGSNSRDGYSTEPVVAFTVDGAPTHAVAQTGMLGHDLIVGRAVRVAYDPVRPTDCRIAGRGGGDALLPVAIGLALLAGGLLFLLVPGARGGFDYLPLAVAPAVGTGLAVPGLHGLVLLHRIRSGVRAEATVVGAVQTHHPHGLAWYHLQVRFWLRDGTMVAAPALRRRLRARPAPGSTVQVRYDPADPSLVLLDGEGPGVRWPLLAALGTAIALAGVLLAVNVLTA